MPTSDIDPLELLNEKTAADRLGLSVHTLRAHRKRGIGIPWVCLGRTVRYRTADVERYLIEHLIEPGRPKVVKPGPRAPQNRDRADRAVLPHLRGGRFV